MNLFEIVRRSPREHRNLTAPAANSLVGIAFQESDTAGTAELSDGTKPLAGFATRAVQVGGPTLSQDVFHDTELPFASGGEMSLEHGEEVEFEGTGYIDGSITSETAIGTELSFTDGKISTKGGGQIGFYALSAILTPEVTGNLRIRVTQLSL